MTLPPEAKPAGIAPRKRVLLGQITAVHGIRGDLVVRSYTGEPGDIASYGRLEAANGTALPALSLVRVTDRGVIVRLAGVADRTAAERYKGCELWIARDQLPAAEDGAYYHCDLIGLLAVAPDGTPVGNVIGVVNFGAGDLLDIRLAGTRTTEYVPFSNAFVPDVDLASGRLTVVRPELAGDDSEGDDGGVVDPQDSPADDPSER